MTNQNLGLGNVSLNSCDNNVNVSIRSDFNGTSFSVAGITLSDVNSDCDRSKLIVYIPIKASGTLKGTPGAYNLSDLIVCTINSVSVTSGVITIEPSALCTVKSISGSIRLDGVNAEDVAGNIGLTMSN